MKRKCINNRLGWLLTMLVVGLTGCVDTGSKKHIPSHHATLDSNITRLTKPVNEQILSAIETIRPEKGQQVYAATIQGIVTYDNRNQFTLSARVAGRIEKLYVYFNNQPVRKGQLLMEIYSPDLVAGQRELIYLNNTGAADNLIEAARRKLLLLGMSPAEIGKALVSGEPLYRVSIVSPAAGYLFDQQRGGAPSAVSLQASSVTTGENGMGAMEDAAALMPAQTSVGANKGGEAALLLREGQYVSLGQQLFALYDNKRLVAEFAFPPKLASIATEGKKLLYYPVIDSTDIQAGAIRLVVPVYRNGQQFTLTRLPIGSEKYRVGQLLQGAMAVATGKGWWLPKTAVLDMGNRAIVFRKEKDVFFPVTITVGIRTHNQVQVMDSIGNWEVAANAFYLIDSESFIPESKQHN